VPSKGLRGRPSILADGLRQPGPSGRKAGRTAQFRVARKGELGGGSARAKRLASDLRRPGTVRAHGTPGRLQRRERRASIGNGGIDPMRVQPSDVTRIIPVAIVVMAKRCEIGSQISDQHRERKEQDYRKNTSERPRHAGMIARGLAFVFAMRVPAPIERGSRPNP
jgi:hypothetical protein